MGFMLPLFSRSVINGTISTCSAVAAAPLCNILSSTFGYVVWMRPRRSDHEGHRTPDAGDVAAVIQNVMSAIVCSLVLVLTLDLISCSTRGGGQGESGEVEDGPGVSLHQR